MDIPLIQEMLGITAGVLVFCAYIFYIVSIFYRKTKPNRATWLMLAAISLVLALSYHDLGAGNTFWTAAGSALGTVTIAVLSIRFGTKGWHWFEFVCIAIIVVSLCVYTIAIHNPLLVLMLGLLMDGCALVPTMYHAYKNPHEEDKFAWTLTLFADILAIFSIESWTFGIILYPVYMVLVNGIVVILIYVAPSKRTKQPSIYFRFSRFILSRSK